MHTREVGVPDYNDAEQALSHNHCVPDDNDGEQAVSHNHLWLDMHTTEVCMPDDNNGERAVSHNHLSIDMHTTDVSMPDDGVGEQVLLQEETAHASSDDDSIADPNYEPSDCSVTDDDEEDDDDDDDILMHGADSVQLNSDNSERAQIDHLESATGTKSAVSTEDGGNTPVSVISESSTDGGLNLLKMKPSTRGCKKAYDKVHYCTFCGKQITSKIARHIINVHADKPEVEEIILQPKCSKKRKLLIERLVNEGNFKNNICAMQKGQGNIVVGRRSSNRAKKPCEYTACEFCKRWLTKNNLWRHMKTCLARRDYYKCHAQEVDNGSRCKRVMAVKRGQSLIYQAVLTERDDSLEQLFNRMRDDDVKAIAISDDLIRREAALRMLAIGRKEDQKHDDIYRVSQAARTLGRIVMLARKTLPSATLDSLLSPSNFDIVVNIAKQMSTDKEQPSLNVGRTVGNLLNKMCTSKYCAALRTDDRGRQDDATNFKKLVEAEWNSRVNRAAVRRIEKERRSKLQVIPLTEDLQKFRDYLVKSIQQYSHHLRQGKCPQDWIMLAKCVMSRLILFNKRRRAEVRELRVDEYLARPKWHDSDGGELTMALSSVDRLLAKR